MTGDVAQAAEAGKVSARIFDRAILPHLGCRRPEVLVGPQHGVDVGIVDLGHDQVMAVTSDPFFVVPAYGWERAAWFAVHIVASDAATSGLRPAYFVADLNLPLGMSDEELHELWTATSDTCRRLGMAVVAGHTARYEGCDYPMLGGATVLAVGSKEQYVTPAMARSGDALLITKGAAIETVGQLGATFPRQLAARLGPQVARAAEDLFWQMSVVEDALIAASAGVRERGVTAMHDATERGVWGAIWELADASQVAIVADQAAIPLRPEVRAVCDLFGIDPYTASSEGTLLLTCRPGYEGAVIERLDAAGIQACRIGEVRDGAGVRVVRGGREEALEWPQSDPFWPAFTHALEEWGDPHPPAPSPINGRGGDAQTSEVDQ